MIYHGLIAFGTSSWSKGAMKQASADKTLAVLSIGNQVSRDVERPSLRVKSVRAHTMTTLLVQSHPRGLRLERSPEMTSTRVSTSLNPYDEAWWRRRRDPDRIRERANQHPPHGACNPAPLRTSGLFPLLFPAGFLVRPAIRSVYIALGQDASAPHRFRTSQQRHDEIIYNYMEIYHNSHAPPPS